MLQNTFRANASHGFSGSESFSFPLSLGSGSEQEGPYTGQVHRQSDRRMKVEDVGEQRRSRVRRERERENDDRKGPRRA